MLALKSPLQRWYSLKSLPNTNIPLNSRWERNIWMSKKASQSWMFSEITPSENIDTCSSCSVAKEGLGMRDHCIQNQLQSACKTYLVGVFWRGQGGRNSKNTQIKQNQTPNQQKANKTTTTKSIRNLINKQLYSPKLPPPPTPYYMLISETWQVLTKCILACGPRILNLIRGLDAFVLGALTFWQTRF